MQIGDRVRKPNSPIVGKVIDIKWDKALVGWRMKYNGKFYMSTKWIWISKLEKQEPLHIKPKSWLRRLFHRLRS